MAFCGQCGLLLPPTVTTCPRCSGAVTSGWESKDQHANDPTIISTADKPAEIGNSSNLSPEPNQFMGDNSETQRVEQGKNTSIPLPLQNTPSPRYHHAQPLIPPPPPDYTPRNRIDFSPAQEDYISTTQGTSYPRSVSATGPGYLPLPVPSRKPKSWGILLVMLFISFLLGATVTMFAVGPSRVLQILRGSTIVSQTTPVLPTSQVPTSVELTPPASISQVPTSALPTPTLQLSLTPEQQAQSVIDRYYIAINNKDYQTSYNLWLNYPGSYRTFVDGFADTSHDDYTFGNVLQQSDGTVQVYITLIATSTSSQQTTYQGNYIVGQQPDGSWKIISASIHKV